MWGFIAISAFMIVYYVLFGVVSVVALASNLLFLIALLSLLQATLTLPGIAAIALTLGMAIDSNITTLIAGIALLVFGSGPVRGFAVVHCLGILTSLFSSVVVSRALVNLIYGRRRKLESLSIGHIWKPGNTPSAASTK